MEGRGERWVIEDEGGAGDGIEWGMDPGERRDQDEPFVGNEVMGREFVG